METTYQHEFNDHLNNGHENEEVFNKNLNGNGSGYNEHEEYHELNRSLGRKSQESAEESDKEDSSSVIIHGSPEPEPQKLQQNADGKSEAS